MEAKDIYFELSCLACPEAYKLMHQGQEIGYMRLRWGILELTAGTYVSKFANDRSETIDIWEYDFDDKWKGAFDSEDELNQYQKLCADKLIEYFNEIKY